MRVLLILMSVMLLTACGQKGPLYLPEASTTTHTTEAAL